MNHQYIDIIHNRMLIRMIFILFKGFLWNVCNRQMPQTHTHTTNQNKPNKKLYAIA